MIVIKLLRKEIEKLANKKYPSSLWGCIQEKGKVLFKVGEDLKEFKTLKDLKKFLND